MTIEELRALLATALGEAALLPGTSFGETGKRFSIKLTSGWKSVGIRPSESKGLGGKNLANCDALFALLDERSGRMLMVLVELKGRDVTHALEQLEATFDRLSRNNGGRRLHDVHFAKARLGKRSPHGGRALGIVVAPSFLVLKQLLVKRMTRKGLFIRHEKKATELTPAALQRHLWGDSRWPT